MSIEAIIKKVGPQHIRRASTLPPVRRIQVSIGLDYVFGGGVPINRIIELLGLESSTKTLHAILTCIGFQNWDFVNNRPLPKIKAGSKRSAGLTFDYSAPGARKVVYVDIEGTFDSEWARYQGLDLDAVLLYTPDTLASAVDTVAEMLASPDVGLVVIDSISAVGADAETEKSMEDDVMAINARFWNRAFRKFQAALNRNPDPQQAATLIAINTFGTRLNAYGDPNVAKNGNGLKYAKSVSATFTALSAEKTGDSITAIPIKIECTKNKTAPPRRRIQILLNFDPTSHVRVGCFDTINALVSLAVQFGIIQRSGAWYTYNDIRAQGLEKLVTKISEEGVYEALDQDVRSRF